MDDEQLKDLIATTTPADTDILYTVVDPAGTPLDRKITWTSIKAFLKTYFDGLYATTSQGTLATNALPKGGGTMTGKIIKAGTTEVAKTYTPASGSQTVAIDASVNNMHVVTGHASGTAITFTITGMTENQPIVISILQGAVVSTIAEWFATIRWVGGVTPTLTATVGKRDTFGFIRTGADTYDGFVIGQNC